MNPIHLTEEERDELRDCVCGDHSMLGHMELLRKLALRVLASHDPAAWPLPTMDQVRAYNVSDADVENSDDGPRLNKALDSILAAADGFLRSMADDNRKENRHHIADELERNLLRLVRP